MSSDNVSSTVTYTSVSSGSSEPSAWGILLVNAGEIPDVDPYEEVAQQGQEHPLSPAYVPDPMELDEHVPLYALEPKHPEHHVPSDDDIEAEDQPYAENASPTVESPGYSADSDPMEDDTNADSIDYPDEPGTDDEDSEQDDDRIPRRILDETAATPPSPGHRGARVSVRPQPPMAASTQVPIDACATRSPSVSLPPTSPTYDRVPLGHRAAMIPESSAAAAARAPRGQYDFVDAVEAGQGLVRSSGHDTQTIGRAADRAKDVGYRAAYETELHEVRQAYLSSEARNRALLARLETLETHMSRMEWQHQRAEDDTVRQIMHTQVLEARARIDTMEDADSSY
ncbi:hypothetical protein Tco_0495838 [Tanacetum coccineum]